MADITEYEAAQIDAANSSKRSPVVFVHGLWLLPNSWDRWREMFEAEGYTTLAPGWPDDPNTVAEAQEHPEVFAHKTVGQVADHFEAVIGKLKKRPVLIGHSFGGLLAQILAGRGVADATVAIDAHRSAACSRSRSPRSSRPRRCSGIPRTTGTRSRSRMSNSGSRSPTR